ncbi:MAG: energy-coupling factor transporter transmembrane component T family protein [Candidatus Helarchaeota archaeon]
MSINTAAILDIFKFKRKNTIIHKLDPRTKLYYALVISILALIFVDIIPLMIIFVSTIPMFIAAKSLRNWYYTIKGLFILVLIIVIIDTLFISFSLAISMVFRLFSLITSFSLFFLTTHPDDFSQALIQMHIPYSFAFTLSLSVRFIPTLGTETQTVMEAQMSRGLELQKGNMLKRVRNFIPIIVPMIVLSIRRALLIAESLESRGFGVSETRTYLYKLKMSWKDYLIIVFLTLILVLSVIFVYYIGLPQFLIYKIPF